MKPFKNFAYSSKINSVTASCSKESSKSKKPVQKTTNEKKSKIKCAKHSSEDVQFYCLQCEEAGLFCCICCLEHTQKEHDVFIVEKAWKIVRDVQVTRSLKTQINVAQNNACNLYINLHNKQQQLNATLIRTEQTIKESIEELVNFVANCQKDFLGSCVCQVENIEKDLHANEMSFSKQLTRYSDLLKQLSEIEAQTIEIQCDWFRKNAFEFFGLKDSDLRTYSFQTHHLKNYSQNIQCKLDNLKSFITNYSSKCS